MGVPPGQVGPWGLALDLAQGLEAAGSSVSSRQPRQHWDLLLQLLLYLGHEEQVAATVDKCCPNLGVGTGVEGDLPHEEELLEAPG